MPSKTMTHAYNGTSTTLNSGIPRNSLTDFGNVRFIESRGAALEPVKNALFGKERYARDRIHWMFPPDKDERVAGLLTWIQTMAYNLGEYGLHKFLQTRERGALISNAEYRHPQHPNSPAFDWLSFDQLHMTMDKIMQESVAFYNPAVHVIVFVFLPSKSGNSVAMWRRKINVPNNARLTYQGEINVAIGGLRRDKDYVVHVDQLPRSVNKKVALSPKATKVTKVTKVTKTKAAPALPQKPKKRKWWQIFG
ncbi:hypothetical protein BDQ12DRAFT_169053 [Crucibulum laeve]|uniref:CcmS related domain-containing protein n=1 Tax=Crucibulum laeve TaxID=68775 RepID=A0A5C3MGZ8_9AGAR|nr:hypothetical protein BDQ12DRAFT_169053 [Crucibulum laeve]